MQIVICTENTDGSVIVAGYATVGGFSGDGVYSVPKENVPDDMLEPDAFWIGGWAYDPSTGMITRTGRERPIYDPEDTGPTADELISILLGTGGATQ